jgi:2-iminobutanoate/2-iminopropanoate deaminase
MEKRAINAPDAPQPVGSYAQAVEIGGGRRTLYISGQIPQTADGKVPEGFPDQCRLAWANLAAQLRAADMSLDNLVKVTTFLADRRFGLENRAIRQEVLGDRRPALTAVITGIFDVAWLVEIEAVAVA